MGANGAHPRGPLLGDVAGEVVQTAPCDVLLVPHPRGGSVFVGPAPARARPHRLFGRLAPARRLCRGLARDLGAVGVDLVHVLEPLPHPFRWIDEALVDAIPEIRDRADAALRELADEVGRARPTPPRRALRRARQGGPNAGTGGRRARRRLDRDGPHAERPVFDRLLGSVAEGVARRAPCPVLVARRSAATEPGADDVVDPESYWPEAA